VKQWPPVDGNTQAEGYLKTIRKTMAQALISFLKHQYVERDGVQHRFIAGVWGIFGHGNVAGVGQALNEDRDMPYHLPRNEQSMVHSATAFAKMSNRLSTFACTSSIGPGATNMITGAATATINRLPVLLLPGDHFARRNVAPVLQQLESEHSQDISVNDCFKPVSRYWDRINRADQLPFALLEAMRVLTSPVETGAVTLALPQDVQTEAWDYPGDLFEKRVWHIPRQPAEHIILERAAALIRSARRPLIVAGGGVIYSEATETLDRFARETGIPVGETQAGKGSLSFDHPQNLGAIGVTGTPGANIVAREADLVIAIGTRLGDFTTASKTEFQNPDVRFIGINVAGFDAHKHNALPVVADARAALDELRSALKEFRVADSYSTEVTRLKNEWETESDRLFGLRHGPPLSQSQVIGAVNASSAPEDVVLGAAGSLPGDLHKLWRTRNPKGYHMEYGYSCMGYEIAAGLGVKMADPKREVYVMIGDGSYLMMAQELTTAIAEGIKINVVVLDNHGFSSIGGLSRSVGSGGFGTDYRYRHTDTGQFDGEVLPVDLALNASSLGANSIRVTTHDELLEALKKMREATVTTVIVVEVDKEMRVPGYESWWDVPIAEVSQIEAVQRARAEYEKAIKKERSFL
jgi:3D-(3,5/4)-trihydroxycyclohexane-1,2-dione acylhydrolase (decyclizing)